MLKIAAGAFAFVLFLFLAFLFWELAVDSDTVVLSALFGALTIVFIFCAAISCLAIIGAFLAFGNGCKE